MVILDIPSRIVKVENHTKDPLYTKESYKFKLNKII
jgi:hypothetical protein